MSGVEEIPAAHCWVAEE